MPVRSAAVNATPRRRIKRTSGSRREQQPTPNTPRPRDDAPTSSPDAASTNESPLLRRWIGRSTVAAWPLQAAIGLAAIPIFPNVNIVTVMTFLAFLAAQATQVLGMIVERKIAPARVGLMLGVFVIAAGLIGIDRWYDHRREGDLIAHARGDDPIMIAGGTVDITGDAIALISGQDQMVAPSFFLEPFEVTNDRYRSCVEAGVCDRPENADRFDQRSHDEWPVTNISPEDAHEFCTWIGRRLMTEREYVHAVRGTGSPPRRWPWGEGPPDPTHAHLDYRTEADTPPPFDGTGPLPTPPDLSGNEPLGTTQPPETERQPVSVNEMAAGRTPDTALAHLVGNVAEWTATSPELCANRADCTTSWTPGDPLARTLILRGPSYLNVVINGDTTDAEPTIGSPVPIEPPLRAPDIGFRCATTT